MAPAGPRQPGAGDAGTEERGTGPESHSCRQEKRLTPPSVRVWKQISSALPPPFPSLFPPPPSRWRACGACVFFFFFFESDCICGRVCVCVC